MKVDKLRGLVAHVRDNTAVCTFEEISDTMSRLLVFIKGYLLTQGLR